MTMERLVIKNRWWDRALMTSALVVGIIAMFELVSYIARDTRPPITVHALEVLNSPVQPGEDLMVRIYREKVRDCPLTSYRYVVDRDGRKFDLLDEAKATGGPVGSDYVDVEFPLVPPVPPGRYTFYNTAVYHCDGDTYVIQHPPVEFRILPPGVTYAPEDL